MTDHNLNDLDPRLLPVAMEFLDKANTALAPSTVRITTTWRDPEAQQQAYDAGLSNARPGQSPHECMDTQFNPAARAFDWSIFEPDGTYIKDGKDLRYAQGGAIVQRLGLIWGGTFSKPDWDHAELAGWKTLAPAEPSPSA